jgi:acetylglutamate kinase
VPVIASIGALDGGLINLNADDVAVTIAAAAGAQDLVVLSDTPGLVLDGRQVRQLDAAGLTGALSHPDVRGGMLAKLRSIARALEHGVVRIHLGTWNGPGTLNRAFSGDWEGTRIETLPMTTSPDRERATLEVR